MIQTDKNESQRKALRVMTKTVGGDYGTAGKPFSKVIGQKRRWCFETRAVANGIREDQIDREFPARWKSPTS